MTLDIPFLGCSTTPSDYDCRDGELAYAIGATPRDGGLRLAPQPRHIVTLSPGAELRTVHAVSQGNVFIYAGLVGDDSNTYKLQWAMESAPSAASDLAIVDDLRDIRPLGNILAAATAAGVRYFIWKDGTYRDLGYKPPFPVIEFSMAKAGTLADEDDVEIPSKLALRMTAGNGVSTSRYIPDQYKSDLELATNGVLGFLLSSVADEVNAKGLFYQPFFVRYAYRLFDGSYCWQSAPILMLPTTTVPLVEFIDFDKDGDIAKVKSRLAVDYFRLQRRILAFDGNSGSSLAAWKDFITAVDVFISAPVYTYDQSKSVGLYAYRHLRAVLDAGITKKDRPFNMHFTRPSSSEVYLMGEYDNAVHSISRADAADNKLYWHIMPNDNFHRQLCDVHDFYLVASIPFDNLSPSSAFTNLKLDVDDVSAVQALTRLPDDYLSHATVVPACLYPYNSRLNLAGVDLMPPSPLPIRSLGAALGESSSSAVVKVWSIAGGCTVVSESSFISGDANKVSRLPRYIFHPDSSAFMMKLSVGSKSYTIPLKPHDFLNGAYYYGGLGTSDDEVFSESAVAPLSAAVSAPVRNKVYTSEVGNPFVFRPENITTVGSGNVIVLAAAAAPLSTGQFGQFPLYAFTDEGVWALSVSSSGGFSARQPITRDVCLGSHSVASLDSSVVFASSRGIMHLSGSSVKCISDALSRQSAFSLASLRSIDMLHSPLADNLTYNGDTCLLSPSMAIMLPDIRVAYIYAEQILVVFSPLHSMAFTLSLDSGKWGMMHSSFRSAIDSYPQCLFTAHNNRVVSLEKATAAADVFIVSRPLRLGLSDILKSLDTLILRGDIAPSSKSSIVVYGSRDLHTWVPVWSGNERFLRGFSGTPYKAFRLAMAANLSPDDCLSDISVNFRPRYNNRLR